MNRSPSSSPSPAHDSDDINKLLELQEGLKDLLKRVATVHEEHDKKKEENAMLQKVIANLMNSNAVIGDIASK
ncbi:hypothetical protein B0O80DRAFT_501010 [Mortierella sp. GBAus27b]|nr:hypothetical protein B0O80DRAFT_501010 [Mortierella sp. GBAus27b]